MITRNPNSDLRGPTPSEKPATTIPVVLTPKEAAQRLRLSSSWLAKARMRGDGPPYIQIGRAIRYTEAALIQWMKSRQRPSTSEQ
jgi:predicted DNA-binding transcriptional regulator AlpA